LVAKVTKKTPKKLSKKRAAYLGTVGGFLNYTISLMRGLLLIPLYLKYIDVDLYGYWLSSGGVVSLLTFMNLGISSNVLQKISHNYGKGNYSIVKTYFVLGLIILLAIIILLVLVVLIITYFLPSIYSMSESDAQIIQYTFLLSALSLVFTILTEYINTLNSSMLQPFWPSIIKAFWGINGILSTVLLLERGEGLYALPIGKLLASGGGMVVIIILSIKRYSKIPGKIIYSFKYVKHLLIDSILVFLGKTSQSIAKNIEPVLITLFIGPTATTAYTITTRSAKFILMAVNIPLGAVFPSFVNLVGTGNQEKVHTVINKLTSVMIISLSIILSGYILLNESFVTIWAGKNLFLGNTFTQLIAISFGVRILLNLMFDIIFGFGFIKTVSTLQLIDGAVRVLFMTLFLNTLGITGIPIGLFFSSIIMIVFLIIKNRTWFTGNKNKNTSLLSLITFITYSILVVSIAKYYMITINSWSTFIFFGICIVIILCFPILIIKPLKNGILK